MMQLIINAYEGQLAGEAGLSQEWGEAREAVGFTCASSTSNLSQLHQLHQYVTSQRPLKFIHVIMELQ